MPAFYGLLRLSFLPPTFLFFLESISKTLPSPQTLPACIASQACAISGFPLGGPGAWIWAWPGWLGGVSSDTLPQLTSDRLWDMSLSGGHRLKPGSIEDVQIWSGPRAVSVWISGLCQQNHILSVTIKKNNKRNIILKSRRVEYFPVLFLYSMIRRVVLRLVIMS